VGGARLMIDVEADRWGAACRVDADLDALYDRWAYSLERALS